MRPALTLFALFIAFAAHAAIRVTPEAGLADPVRAPLDGNQSAPIVATDGDQYMVFWTSIHGIHAAHVGADGRLVSSRLALPDTSALGMSVTWTGAVYLTTWRDSAKNALFAAAFTKAGDLLSAPIPIVPGPAQTRTGALASNGHRTLLLYSYSRPNDVKAAIFDVNGALLGADRSITAPGTASNFSDLVPLIASDGEEFAMVWRTGAQVPIAAGVTAQADPPPLSVLVHDFHLIRLNEDGAVLGSQIDIGRTDQTAEFGVASGGGIYAIVATESHLIKPGQTQTRLVRISVDARRGSVDRLPTIDIIGGPASVFWSGSTFVAFWMRSTDTSFSIVTLPFSGGDERVAPLPVTSLTGTSTSYMFSMRSNGRTSYAAWNQNTGRVSGEGSEIYGSLFDATASMPAMTEAPTLVSVGWSRQFMPSMASSPTGSLAIWIEEGYSRQLFAVRIDASGAFIGAPFLIANDVARASVVFAGDLFLVAFEKTDTSVVIRSVGRDASLGSPVSLGPGWGIAAASNGNTALVVFSQRGTSAHLIGYRFDASGRQIDLLPLVISNGYLPQVASNGTDFFVAWNEGNDYWQFPSPNMIDVMGTRVSANGTLDAAPLAIATGPEDQRLVSIASDGRDYLVAYVLGHYPPTALATKVILHEGQLGGATATETGSIIASDAAYAAALSGDATGYWIAYLTANGTGSTLRLDQKGTPLTAAVTVGAGISSMWLVRSAGGTARMLYARTIAEGAFTGTSRVFLRTVGDDVPRRSRATLH